jgi:hypothetical protein
VLVGFLPRGGFGLGQLAFQIRDAPLVGQLTFQVRDALLRVVLIHQQIVARQIGTDPKLLIRGGAAR